MPNGMPAYRLQYPLDEQKWEAEPASPHAQPDAAGMDRVASCPGTANLRELYPFRRNESKYMFLYVLLARGKHISFPTEKSMTIILRKIFVSNIIHAKNL